MKEFALLAEMNEVPNIMRRFDPRVADPWRPFVQTAQKILLTGEGSSRIFPAKNLIAQALKRGTELSLQTGGARQAAEYALQDFLVIGASNSGQTRELIDLYSKISNTRLALTATPHSKIIETATHSIVLTCGKEKATAATKSVVEQALFYQALLGGAEWQHLSKAADLCAALLTQKIPSNLVKILAQADTLYFAGRDDGVAEELALKTNEITRQRSQYLEGTLLVHGIEEVMHSNECVILIEPFAAELEKIQQVLAKGVGMHVLAIASYDTPFPTIKIPQLKGFDAYFQLLAGWNILAATGLNRGIDFDTPLRARKIGNAV